MIFISLSITLIFGTILSLRSVEMLIYYAIYYALCFLALKSFKYGKDFFLSFDKERIGFINNKIKLAGQEITSNIEEDKQEDRFLNVFETYRVVKRKFLSWALFLGGIWFFYYKNGQELSINSLVPVLSCFFIVNSFFVGHLLVAVLLNAVLVTFNYSPDLPVISYFLYIFSFLISLYLISKTLEENLSETLAKKKLITISLLSLLFFVLCLGFKTALPDEIKFDKEPGLSKEQMTKLQEYLNKSRVDLGDIKSKLPGLNSGTLTPRIDLNSKQIEELAGKLQQRELTDAEKEKILSDMKSLMENMKNLKTDFNQSLGAQGGQTFSEIEKDSFSKLKDDLELSDEEKNNLASFINKTSEQLNSMPPSAQKESISNEMEKIQKAMQEKTFSAKEQADITEALQKIASTQNALAENSREEAIKAANIAPEPDQNKQQEILEPLQKKEQPETSWFEKFKRILAIAALALTVFYLHHLLKKKGISKIEATDPEVLKEMQDEWKKIRKLKLSPREEVIFHYNLFHESLQKIHYNTHEAPPSCRIYDDMKELNPDLEKPTFIITEVFAQCFYGNKEVNNDSLKLFRKALTKILRVYQLSY